VTHEFILLRHGESVGNAEDYYQGQHDFELTERGRGQAQALAERWAAEGTTFERIIASPLARARQTAEIINEALGLPLEFDPIWMERDNGKLAGLSHAEAAGKYPQPDFISPYEPIGETGEGQWSLYLRAAQALEKLMQLAPGRYLIVSHGGILNMLMLHVVGLAPQANFQGARFAFGNTGFSTVTFQPEMSRWIVTAVNDRSHLGTPPTRDASYHFTLLRHGESQGNADKIIQGQNDLPLTSRGQQEATALAADWKNAERRFDQILASPLQRAKKTAEIVQGALGGEIEYDPIWMERDYGQLTGKKLDSASVKDSLAMEMVHIHQPIGPDGESFWLMQLRAGRALHKLLQKPPGRYLIVSHGAFLNSLLSAMLGYRPQTQRHATRFAFTNTAYCELDYHPHEHKWRLARSNVQSHLESLKLPK